MKLTVFLLLLSVFSVLASKSYSQTKELNLNMKNSTVKEVLRIIEKQSEFVFMYSEKLIDVNREVSMNVKNKKINEILDELFAGTDVSYKVKDRFVLLTTPEVSGNDLLVQQQKSVSGKVTDSSGKPLPGVTVVVKGTTQGTVTNADGEYTLTDISDDATLVFSFVGMISREIVVKDQDSINVTLVSDIIGIEEVVAIGYGSMKKSDFTGSVKSVKLEESRPVVDVNVAEALQGLVAGLNVTVESGAPGSGAELLIRGERSLLASNSPLVIVDGFPSSLNSINPGDIESINVLKDVSAAAIYGARAANGVILITTKIGGDSKLEFTINSNTSIEQPNKRLDIMNGAQYLKKVTDAADFKGIEYNSVRDLLQRNQLDQYDAGTEIDWFDLVYGLGVKTLNTISARGTTENSKFYHSISMQNHDGMVDLTSYDRYNLRSNVTHTLNDWIEYTSRISAFYADNGPAGPLLSGVTDLSPYGKLKDENGNYEIYPQFPETFIWNPYADYGTTRDNTNRGATLIQGFKLSPKFIPGLSYKIEGTYNFTFNEEGLYYPKDTYTGRDYNGLALTNKNTNATWLINNELHYIKSFGNHNLNFTGVYSAEENNWRGESIGAYDFPVTGATLYHFVQSAETLSKGQTATWDGKSAIESLMGRLNYNYDNRYYLGVTVRRDGYSGFAKFNETATFPVVSGAWNISNEGFFKNSPIGNKIELLKIKGSYGDAGNMAGIGAYSTLDRYTTVNYVWGDQTALGTINSGIGNKYLSWETTRGLNLAVEFSMLNHRLSGEIGAYKSRTFDLLMGRSVPIVNGYGSISDNIGETENKGLEVDLKGLIINSRDFKWDASMIMFMYRDKITKLRADEERDLVNGWFVGEPISSIFDYNQIGVFDNQAEVDASPMNDGSGVPGGQILEDINDDGVIDEDDRTIIGVGRPLVTASLVNNFSYKDLTVGFTLYTVQKTLRYNSRIAPAESNKLKNMAVIDYWTPENTDAKYVSPGYDTPVRAAGYYMDASFLRMRSAYVSYNIRNIKAVKNLELTLECKNVFVISDWIGYNPEGGAYGLPRTYTLGINFNF